MVHYADTVGTLYFYAPSAGADAYLERRPYVAVCTVIWLWEGCVWLKALRGDMSRAMQNELIEWLMARGIKKVKAEREPGRSLPLARRIDDHEEVDVAELYERFVALSKPGGRRYRATDPPDAPGFLPTEPDHLK